MLGMKSICCRRRIWAVMALGMTSILMILPSGQVLAGTFPHEPAGTGWTTVFDTSWKDKSGWNDYSKTELATTQTAEPISPPSALMYHWPIGNYDHGLGTIERLAPKGYHAIYSAFSVKWEGAYNISGNTGAKWIFHNSEPGCDCRFMGHFAGPSHSVDRTEPIGWTGCYEDKIGHVEPWARPNLVENPTLELGRWYRIEMFLEASSTVGAADGQYHVWITDDRDVTTKVTQLTNLRTGADPMNFFALNPMMGDGDPSFARKKDHYFYLGHWRLKGAAHGAISALGEANQPSRASSRPVSTGTSAPAAEKKDPAAPTGRSSPASRPQTKPSR